MKRGIFLKIFIAMMLVSLLDDVVRYEQNLVNFIWSVFLTGVVSFYVASGIARSMRSSQFESDRIEATHEREVDQLKSDFISIASHQLRTPLSVVKWLTKMILTEDLGPLNKEQKDYLERAYESNERMVGLVNDLLNVSRIEEGKLVFKEDDVRINNLVKEVLKAYEIIVAKNKLTLTTDFMKEDAVIKADKEKLYMAFSNVIDNAIKFTPRGGEIAVAVKKENDQVVVAVTDSGIGISPKDQTHLFEKFFRAENARLVHTEGSGLGLFIIKNIILRHGGTVEVRSELQKGTTVVCTLPMQKGIA